MNNHVDVTKLHLEQEWGYWYSYDPILNAFGKIVCRVDDRAYSGDSRVLYDEGDKIGFLMFGWGSCSGCDALQACRTLEEVQKLCDKLQDSIKWFDDRYSALEWFSTHDWEGDYSWYAEETKRFVAMAKTYLSKEN